jgi:hypothetical protein
MEPQTDHNPRQSLFSHRHEAEEAVNKDLSTSLSTNDRKDMLRMGKAQVFRRNFGLITAIAFASCVMSTWEILLATNLPALIHGGLPGLFWSMCWSYLGQFFVVISLAEMASMAPTSGGQYHCESWCTVETGKDNCLQQLRDF